MPENSTAGDKGKETSRHGAEASRQGSDNQRQGGEGSRQGGGSSGQQGSSQQGGESGGAMEQARSMVSNVGEQARSAVADAGSTAQDLARRAREQAAAAGDALYQGGTSVGAYVGRNVNEYPFAALLVAGAVGYGLAYLLHTQWQGSGGSSQRSQGEEEHHGRRGGRNRHS